MFLSPLHFRWQRLIPVVVLAASSLGAQEADEGGLARLPEVPERFFQVQDKAGFLWQALDNGALLSGETQYLQSGLNLIVDGEPFRPGTAFASEGAGGNGRMAVRLEESRNGLGLSRHLWFDRERSGVRIWDRFTNNGTTESTHEVILRTTYPFAWQSLHGTGGGLLGADPLLRPGDYSLAVHFSPAEGRHDTFLIFGSEKGGQRPEVKSSANSRELVFSYSVTVPPGESRFLLHWILQRNLADPAQDGEVLAPFVQGGQWIDPELEGKFLNRVTNLVPEAFPATPVAASGLKALVALNSLHDSTGLYRRSEDVLWLGPSNGIAGALDREGSLKLATALVGEVEIPKAQIAAIRGTAGQGGRIAVYLRDGRVYAGKHSGGDLSWTTKGAVAESLNTETFHLLLLGTGSEDGVIPPGTTHFVELGSGTVLAVAPEPTDPLNWAGPWGPESAPWSELVELRRERAGAAGWRARWRDGGSGSILLPHGKIAMKGAGSPVVEVPAVHVERIWSVGHDPILEKTGEGVWLDFAELPAGIGPAEGLILKGNQVLAAKLGPGRLTLDTGGSLTPVDTAQIAGLVRSSDPETPDRIDLLLLGGEKLSGQLIDPYLPVQRGEVSLSIPSSRILSYRRSPSS